MEGVTATGAPSKAIGSYLVRLPVEGTAGRWGLCAPLLSPLVQEMRTSGQEHRHGNASRLPCVLDAPAVPEPPVEWIGGEPRTVAIAGGEYSLSFVFVGASSAHPRSPAIDPNLPVAEVGEAADDLPGHLVTYDGFDPATRRAFLEWIHGGRCDASVPMHFAVLVAHFLETAIFIQNRRELAATAAEELERLLRIFAKDRDCRCFLQPLIDACRLLDTSIAAPPEFASAITNHANEMPFAKRLYLGRELQQSRLLEADPALLFLLEQPRTHLDAQVAAAFVVVYYHWTENYAFRFNGGAELRPTRTISLSYETLDGENCFEINSSIPDPASASVPAELSHFFEECCAEVEQLRGLPVAQQTAIIRGLKSSPQFRRDGPAWSVRPDFEERLNARLSGAKIVLVPAVDVFADLFEHGQLAPNRRVPRVACRRMQRALDQVGIGFEPDDRYGLPARLRPDGQVALFRDDCLAFTQPSNSFNLGQAVMVLSALGTMRPFAIEPISASDIELRLPNAHPYSDRELRRLDATFRLIRQTKKPREMLASWPRSMKRLERIRHIDLGFGIAFHAQSQNPMVKRFATAVSKALHDDDRRASTFLQEVNRQAEIDVEFGKNDIAHPRLWGQEPPSRTEGTVGRDGAVPSTPGALGTRGLSPILLDILQALLSGPRQRAELNDVARRGQLQLAGALEQLNEWSLSTLNAQVTRGHNPVRINPDVFDAIELMVAL